MLSPGDSREALPQTEDNLKVDKTAQISQIEASKNLSRGESSNFPTHLSSSSNSTTMATLFDRINHEDKISRHRGELRTKPPGEGHDKQISQAEAICLFNESKQKSTQGSIGRTLTPIVEPTVENKKDEVSLSSSVPSEPDHINSSRSDFRSVKKPLECLVPNTSLKQPVPDQPGVSKSLFPNLKPPQSGWRNAFLGKLAGGSGQRKTSNRNGTVPAASLKNCIVERPVVRESQKCSLSNLEKVGKVDDCAGSINETRMAKRQPKRLSPSHIEASSMVPKWTPGSQMGLSSQAHHPRAAVLYNNDNKKLLNETPCTDKSAQVFLSLRASPKSQTDGKKPYRRSRNKKFGCKTPSNESPCISEVGLKVVTPEAPRSISHRRTTQSFQIPRTYIRKATSLNQCQNPTNAKKNSSQQPLPAFDLQFGGLLLKLHRKLSAKCHCQFDVWEAEVVATHRYDNTFRGEPDTPAPILIPKPEDSQNKNSLPLDEIRSLTSRYDLAYLHSLKLGYNKRFALKILNMDSCDPAKLKYKTHSIIAEGKQLKELEDSFYDHEIEVMGEDFLHHYVSPYETVPDSQETIGQRRIYHPKSDSLFPVPDYLWTCDGRWADSGNRAIAVGMEMINGRSLTHLLQQLRYPAKPSAALLVLEIGLKIVESQRILCENRIKPLINWDTKPGNIIIELSRCPNGRLRCDRAVIVDLGDALPGPTYSFPTRHRPGDSPGYIICTKGYCSPECAILVFLLASSSRCGVFRKVWYSESACLESLREARNERIQDYWQDWIKEGFLTRKSVAAPEDADPKNTKTGERGFWEVKFSEKSVVFSTGLVLAQLFGGPNLLQLVQKNEVQALDNLCEWNNTSWLNAYTGESNISPYELMPQQGIFSEDRWYSKLSTLLNGCLAFLPSQRWSFRYLEMYLVQFLREYRQSLMYAGELF